jgi:hypothetical protein
MNNWVLRTEPTTGIGQPLPGGAVMGEVNCGGAVTSVDALLILRNKGGPAAGLPPGWPGF